MILRIIMNYSIYLLNKFSKNFFEIKFSIISDLEFFDFIKKLCYPKYRRFFLH